MPNSLKGLIVPVTGFQQNCTILYDDTSKACVIVDPGGDVPLIEEAISNHNLIPEAIWLTHGHIDHAGGAMDLKDRLSVSIIGPHQDDAPLLEGLAAQAKMFNLSDSVRNVVPDQWLDDGDSVSVGEHSFRVVHCPGHAPGHVIFINDAMKFVHVGDVLFRGSIGRTDLPGGDHAMLLQSISEKVLPLGDDYTFICGHGPGGRIGEERMTNPFLQGIA
ncbi:MAG: MBL fold metallo-hydrolase [Pseudomonadota bacterium]